MATKRSPGRFRSELWSQAQKCPAPAPAATASTRRAGFSRSSRAFWTTWIDASPEALDSQEPSHETTQVPKIGIEKHDRQGRHEQDSREEPNKQKQHPERRFNHIARAVFIGSRRFVRGSPIGW